jgi:D-beta-D-heptose 7-phosphate kinase / D-beta-D-heptose 1-phosphate adenosyltransferase
VRGGPLVVIGDTLLDVDLEGAAERLAPDSPVPVVDCQRERHRAGGAGLAAILAAGLASSRVTLVTALGDDRPGGRLREILRRHVETVCVPLRGSTPCKIRVRASGQSLVRLDMGDGRAVPRPADTTIERILREAGAILISDYGRGMTSQPWLPAMLTRLPGEVPVVWDPHPAGRQPLPGVRLVTPNRAEARAFAAALGSAALGSAMPAGTAAIAQAARDATSLAGAWDTAVAVTIGERGAVLSMGDTAPFVAPAVRLAPVPAADACGAGDCFAAAAAQVLRGGGLLTEALVEAVSRASEFVAQGGAAAAPSLTVPAVPAARTAPVPPRRKAAWDVISRVRARGGTVVATGGCFDLLHAGHVSLLRNARSLGDCLVVCLNSDSSVRALKGPGRPLVGAADRARVLMALECVTAVITFDQPTPSDVLERLRPDVWVKGGDYASTDLAEGAVVRRYGGEVVLLPYVQRKSTSRIVAAARALTDQQNSLGARIEVSEGQR